MFEFAKIAVATLVVFFLLRFLLSYLRWRNSPLWSLPGPRRSTWLLGHFPTIVKEPFMDPQKRWIKEAGGYDNNPVIHYTLPAGEHYIMVLDTGMVQEILFSNHGKNTRFIKGIIGELLMPFTGDGLLTLEGEDWQRHRRITHPSFQPKGIKASLDAVVPDLANQLILYWKKAEGKEIDVMAHISNIALDVIGKVALSHEFRAMESVEKWANGEINNEDGEALPSITDRLIVGIEALRKRMPRLIMTFTFKIQNLDFATKKIVKSMNAAVDEIIHTARAKLEETNITSNDGNQANNQGDTHLPRSLLQALFDAKDTDPSTHARKFLDDLELREEVKTFIFAGHETTATWCYWAVFALCKHPDVQEKVYNDVMSTCADNDDISVASVEKMTYLDAFLKETLRMYPPVGANFRNTVKDDIINGIKIPADTLLMIPIHLLHRHPKYWDDPDTFKPERWQGNDAPMKHKQAFLPFSDGPRNCIGYHFATIEAKLIMAHLIREFTFRLAPSVRNEQFTFNHSVSITVTSIPNLMVCVHSRTE